MNFIMEEEEGFDYHLEHAKVTLEKETNIPPRVRAFLGIIIDLCKKGLELEAENRTLQERVCELEKTLIEVVKMEVSLPECAVCWERDKCTDRAHGDNCLAIGYIIDTAMEDAKEAGNDR